MIVGIVLARLINTAFFVLTSAYCLLTYNAFAYRQFIKPRLISWLSDFVAWHHLGYWLVLLTTAWTLRPALSDRRERGRWMAWSYLCAAGAVGVLLLFKPVLPQVETGSSGLLFALAALVPPVWLACYDHAATHGRVWLAPSSPRRIFCAGLLAGAAVWLAFTVWMPWRLDRAGDIALSLSDVAFGVATSALAHLVGCTIAAAGVVAVLAAAARIDGAGRTEYRAAALLAWTTIACACYRIVFGGLAFTGRLALLVAIALGLALTLVWSGVARRITAERGAGMSAADAWLSPLPGIRSRRGSFVAMGVAVAAGFAALSAIEGMDWDFLVQKMLVAVLWSIVAGYAYGLLPRLSSSLTWQSLAAPPVLAVALLVGDARLEPGTAAHGTRFVPEFALEGYVALDPSFRLLHDLLRVESTADAAFYGRLRANSNLQDAHVDPVSVDFVPAVTATPGSRPNIFLFVIDSLRRDYLSPYNPAVTFTPSIDRFARDSVVFDRAFTRYGGTGLSVPALWSGGMLFHKQYVTPFAPMNALMKLLDGEGYLRVMSMDSVVAQLLPRDASLAELDRDTKITEYDLCGTLGELRAALDRGSVGNRPIFAYSLPQNLHIARVRFQPVPSTPYPGFYPQVAAQLQRLDGCFGSFVDDLKARHLYDDSIIVVTSDHGDLLGEFGRWGHSYLMFPEIVRIPLIVHLPPRLRERFVARTDDPVLSTDLTPSLYALLGHPPSALGPLFGRPMFRDAAHPTPPLADEPRLLASSYGPVYAVLRDNGRRLYIADGVNSREYGYDLSAMSPVRVGVTAGERDQNRAFIGGQLDELARLYQFHPNP